VHPNGIKRRDSGVFGLTSFAVPPMVKGSWLSKPLKLVGFEGVSSFVNQLLFP